MRSALSFLVFLSFALGLSAAVQTFSVTAQTLAGWSLVGAEATALFGDDALSLPANAQLARSFPATDLAVQLVTQPVLGENAADWPVLELGRSAFVFTRSGPTGRLVLVSGEEAPQELPFTFALDAEGRSLEVLALGFSRQAATLTVTFAGQSLHLLADPSEGALLPIIVSAGATPAWDFSRFEVTVNVREASVAPVRVRATEPVSLPLEAAAVRARVSAPGKPMTRDEWIAANRAADKVRDPRAPLPAVAASPRAALEIFTPPAVRHGRAAVVRAVVSGQAAN